MEAARSISYHSWTLTACPFGFTNPKKDEGAQKTSIFCSDILKAMESTPDSQIPLAIAKVTNCNDKLTAHFISDPNLQKLVEKTHRYGPNPKEKGNSNKMDANQSHPYLYTDDLVRQRVNILFKKPNFLTFYEGENQNVRKETLTFFNQKFLTYFEKECIGLTEKWVKEALKEKRIFLFQSISELIAQQLIKGILGYKVLDPKDLKLQTKLWKKLFTPEASELYHVEEQSSISTGEKVANFFYDLNLLASKAKKYAIDLKKMKELTKKIIGYGCSEEGKINPNLPAFLSSKGIQGDLLEGAVAMMLLAGQETLSYLLGFILYEFAENATLADSFALCTNPKDYNAILLEGLRMYPTGGVVRKAGVDILVEHPNLEDEYHINRGDVISCIPYIAGRDASQWKNPNSFDPSRDHISKVKEKVVPFGHGAHSCIGQKAVELQTRAALSVIIPKVRLKTLESLPEIIDSVVVKPRHDIEVIFEERA